MVIIYACFMYVWTAPSEDLHIQMTGGVVLLVINTMTPLQMRASKKDSFIVPFTSPFSSISGSKSTNCCSSKSR